MTDSENPIDTHPEHPHRRGVYLIPNLLTTSALFSGFFSIISSMNGDYSKACIAIFVAQLLDGADGRVARMTHTQSEFGAQYDSMSDIIAFGLAPAILAFQWSLTGMDKAGWVAAFIFVAGAALRLARFNVQIGKVDKKYFVGLASPAGAAVIWATIWSMEEFGIQGAQVSWLMLLLVPLIGIMMVSPVRYFSFKDVSAQRRIPFFALLAIVLVLALIALDPPRVLLGFALVYALHGPFMELGRLSKRKKKETSDAS
ncbi:CDP-diacylglycerol--serine O-phosphatidyltransferase [Reinekea blandensis]|uniref:CDP-diacylglycerol--serine O-phosphatidyltransferase n=1 Tax=Reinekea blandensis MED297 TaxID=314283 RepID=A4BJI6_9GAMM|nr:CDP-diacylglycerol--serine O-phosphatidyltransferase [Reinekea blandensis]EAR07690.1 phosphatidylserine synthase [Reinekea sp. MED297] [Reinekea blandensis MED297]